MALKRVRAVVRGRVQGVFFRASTEREASKLGVAGWVKNLPNGDVELEAEGEEHALRELVAWVHRGPSAARVDHVDVRWLDFAGEFSGFRVA